MEAVRVPSANHSSLIRTPCSQVLATDLDGTSPNNVLVVSFDEDCPLAASRPSYDAQGGVPVPITFVLTQKLDYDTMGASTVVTCSVKVSVSIISYTREFMTFMRIRESTDCAIGKE